MTLSIRFRHKIKSDLVTRREEGSQSSIRFWTSLVCRRPIGRTGLRSQSEIDPPKRTSRQRSERRRDTMREPADGGKSDASAQSIFIDRGDPRLRNSQLFRKKIDD